MLGDAATFLRAVEQDDLRHTRRWRNDPRVWGPALGRRFPITEAGERAWFEQLGQGAFPTHVVWAVVDGDGAMVGLVQLTEINWIHRTCMFGIWIGPEHWGQGHATAATLLACEHAFTSLGLRQVRLEVVATNDAARAIYLKCGFVEEAVLRRAVLLDGRYQDLVLMRCDAPLEEVSP